MISAWLLIPAVIAGALAGVMLHVLVVAGKEEDGDR